MGLFNSTDECNCFCLDNKRLSPNDEPDEWYGDIPEMTEEQLNAYTEQILGSDVRTFFSCFQFFYVWLKNYNNLVICYIIIISSLIIIIINLVYCYIFLLVYYLKL